MSEEFVSKMSETAEAYRNTADIVSKEAHEEAQNAPTTSYSFEYIYRMTMLAVLGVLFVVFLTTSNEKTKKYVLIAMKIWVPLTVLGYIIMGIVYLINK